ncbi:unnamed protein product [Adineta steineri]|uniref:Uncharacterized protein n=1 Tax=Adineta steineri TaxID=433720 RepID=A0A815Z6Q7_9BILA|nr:unnamed protein product [Adineta steineri]CAF1309811.1 unnamed protein product [Adineta steineri]CAF1577654.1 unnamed protein product [Adineta steineri]CAF1579451.1 unnamed protein product [Adineta steineri]
MFYFYIYFKTEDKLNDYCKNDEGKEPNICSEYCKNVHTIDFSYLPSPLDKLDETLVGKLRVGCDGACADGTTCVCTIASGELEETLTKIGYEPYDVADIAYNSTIVIGGKNITVGGLLCENPK